MVSLDGGSACKVDDVTALPSPSPSPSRHKMADMCYYGNVMTTTRWWLCVTMETFFNFLYLVLELYMFRTHFAFIIRSTINCNNQGKTTWTTHGTTDTKIVIRRIIPIHCNSECRRISQCILPNGHPSPHRSKTHHTHTARDTPRDRT